MPVGVSITFRVCYQICVHSRPFAAKLSCSLGVNSPLPEIRESLDDADGFDADADCLTDEAGDVAGKAV